MKDSAALSKLRTSRQGLYSDLHDHRSLPPLHTSAEPLKFVGTASSTANKSPSPAMRTPSYSESPTDDTPGYHITALPQFSDNGELYRPSSSTSEFPATTTGGTTASVASRAHNFVFSLQPPKKFTASLTPNESDVRPSTTGSALCYGDRLNAKNVSTSPLSVAEDAVSHKSGSSRLSKGKLHLLNPLSLLARRRSPQNQPAKAEDASPSAKPPNFRDLPNDYDPRIRGKFIHDFSIPKARRIKSYTGVSNPETSPSIDSCPSIYGNSRASEQLSPFGPLAGRSPQSPSHSPLFKEHFDDDREALQPQDTGYLHTLARSSAVQTANDPPRLPAFAKTLPLDIFGEADNAKEYATPAPVELHAPSSNPHVVPQLSSGTAPDPNNLQSSTRSPNSAVLNGKQLSAAPDFLSPNENLPKHMTSISSRFSFQLSGIDSEAQERLLEEKHKQHAASKLGDDIEYGDSEEERDTDNDLDADDGLEEQIPGVNADWDKGEEMRPRQQNRYSDHDFDDEDGLEEKVPGVNADFEEELEEHNHQSLDPFRFTPLPAGLSPDTFPTSSQPTSRDLEGQITWFANTKLFPDPGLAPQSLELHPKVLEQLPWLGGLGITSSAGPGSPSSSGIVQQLPQPLEGPQRDPDDLYYDDGNIESPDAAVGDESFDEGMFDDGKIFDIPAKNAQQNLLRLSEPGSLPHWKGAVAVKGLNQVSNLSISTEPEMLETAFCGGAHPKDVHVSGQPQPNCLTENNLAYQNALVSAANTAAAQGRFSRHVSASHDSEDLNSKSLIAESHPGLISDDSRISRFFDTDVAVDERDDFPFDDPLGDDPMIAEANAEVLENDDDGFYGQEFGFYARAHGKGNSEMINGGYFGPRGVEGVHRSHSAKANFQEPTLTPITERSEWSHRNSFGSVHTLGQPPAGQAVTSLGIAKLLELDPSFSDDMSLGALMKLRRDAWGGSHTSLDSIGGSQAGSSPVAHPLSRDSIGSQPAALENGSLSGNGFPHQPYESTAILPAVFEEERNHQSTKDVEAQNTPRKKDSDAAPQSTLLDILIHSQALSQISQFTETATQNHSRASSGAESVSYIKDPNGSGRWLLERRRTGDDGETELVGREYVAGARI